ncbi:halocin C8-like domain-containing protein [Natrinema halophilum]|uniref:Uncharacterized protein n=1 Tax=Natrinema halophilum TaxID=1699371 RepID=A0A7D5KXX8_9EURY|nr:halocin C8-like domain-containing protein [Natrinema halophilum]QLG49722.1 hypothetical protein HYG82_13055 [Natrinema halophilum]
MSEGSKEDELNRRKMLKMSAGVSIPTIGLTAASGPSSASHTEGGNIRNINDLEVLDQEQVSDNQASQCLQIVKQSRIGEDFVNDIKNRYEVEVAGVTAFRVTTNSEWIEEKNPEIVLIGVGSKESNSAGGLIYGVIADSESAGRELVVVRGLIVPRNGNNNVSIQHRAQHGTKAIEHVPDDKKGSEIVDRHTLESLHGTGDENSPGTSHGGVSTQSFHGTIGTEVCIGIISLICEKYGSNVARTQCVPACGAVGPSGPFGYTACLAFCALAVKVISGKGCHVGGAVICQEIFERVT